jgi:SAM-dependent methyltransferase
MDNNLLTYNAGSVVKWYEQLAEITIAEKTIFDRYAALISEGDLLDIGIGGGRTTAFLSDKCKSYTGIDYSQEFVSSCKKRFPVLKIQLCDARNLSGFDNNTFDFVNFSFNGIDYTDTDGRQNILSEINRVLKPNGIFFFSTHNKDHSTFYKNPWRNKENGVIINLKTFIKLLPFQFRKLRNRKKE